MSTLAIKPHSTAINVFFSKSDLHVLLADGREIAAPLAWFPKLETANEEERKNWRLIGDGIGIHWEMLDEDIAVKTLLKY
jgi:hypothetical protein